MKWVYFYWFHLAYYNIEFLSSHSINITRKAKLPEPGSSPDEFTLYSSQCLNGKKCEKFGAFQANGYTTNDIYSHKCLCVCKPGRETLFYQDKSWKCLDDKAVRNQTGSSLLFKHQNSSSGLFTFGVGQWTYFSNLLTSLGHCKIKSASSKYLLCNGSWDSLPPTSLFLLIQDANNYFRFQINSIDGLQGRLIKLVINCDRSSRNHCVAFKLQGDLKCPNIDTLNSTRLQFTESKLSISSTTKFTPDSLMLSTSIKSSSTYPHRQTKLPLYTYTVEHNIYFRKSVSFYQTIPLMISSSARLLSSQGIGNVTEMKEINLNNNKRGISVAVLATAVATAFLFGMLLISALLLRKKMFVKQRSITESKRKKDNSIASEPENQLSQERNAAATRKSEFEDEVAVYAQIDSGFAVGTKEPSSSTVLPNYECIWSEKCGSAGYENLPSREGNGMKFNYLPTMSLGKYYMPENSQELASEQSNGGVNNHKKHSKKKSPAISKRACCYDYPNQDDIASLYQETERLQCSYNCDPFVTSSVVQLSTITEEKCEQLEPPFNDILQEPDPNLDLPILIAENRVYGKIEELTPKNDEL